MIVPTGIATDDTCKGFLGDMNEHRQLASLYDFENRERLFPAVDSRMKFSLLTVVADGGIKDSSFAFFLTNTSHLDHPIRRFTLSADDILLINPNTRTMPVFRTKIDADLTKKIYSRVPVLVHEAPVENPWGISFSTMFHMANDSHLFSTNPQSGYLPLYEAKMLWHYDHRFGTYDGIDEDSSSTHLPRPSPAQYRNPCFAVKPRYWVKEADVDSRLQKQKNLRWLHAFRDVTNATNERTVIMAVIPPVGVGHKAPLLHVSLSTDRRRECCLLACINCLVLDYVARQKIGGTSLSYFILKQLPAFSPAAYTDNDMTFIVPRVLTLVYTAHDLKPFAEDMGYTGPPFDWDEDRRALLKSQLDAYYARLYGLTRDELRYVLDPQDVYGPDFPGETFRVLKEKETKQYGEYRTRRLVLDAWDRLEQGELK